MNVNQSKKGHLIIDGYYQIYSDVEGQTHLQIDIGGEKKEAIIETSEQIVLTNESDVQDVLTPDKR